ncbi:hypothetical protein JW916_06545 [Candidatus Sumerlaeota bacterium]|nr:hypothetical protein [Candidatus Sumerlaeota bacterium]
MPSSNSASPSLEEHGLVARLCRGVVFGALALSGVLFLYHVRTLGDLQIDDAFITYRFGARLAHFGTLRWNLGTAFEPVEGYTSLLAVLISAAFELVGVDPLSAWKAIGVLSVAGGAAVAAWGTAGMCHAWLPLAGRCGLPEAVAALVLVAPLAAIHAMSGMETALFGFLLLALTALSIRFAIDEKGERWKGRVLAAGYLILGTTRPEGVLWAAVTGAGVWWSLGRRPERRALFVRAVLWFFILPGAAYFVARWVYFGDFFPATFRAKAGGGMHPSEHGRLATYLPSRHEVWRYVRGHWLCLALVAAAATGTRAVLSWREKGLASLLRGSAACLLSTALASALCIAFFAHVHMLMGFAHRFLFPFGQTFLLTLVVPAFVAIGMVLESGEKARGARRASLLAIGLALAPALGFCSVRTAFFVLDSGIRTFRIADTNNRGDRIGYTLTGEALEAVAERAGRQLTLFHHNMGQLMYYAPHWDSIDPVGLVDRHVAREGFSADYAFGLEPELFLLPSKQRGAITRYEVELSGDVSRALYLDPRMRDEYECLGYYPGLRFWTDGAMHFFVRKDFLQHSPWARDLLVERLGLRIARRFDNSR